MRTTMIELLTPDGPMASYEAIPDAAPLRAVIVVQEAFGINDHIQAVTRKAADAGYHAIAPALFHRAGGGTAPYDDFEKVFPLFEGVDDTGVLTDVDAALAHLHDAGLTDDHIGVVGFCFGGRVTFLAALRRRLGAAVGFYGAGIVTQTFPAFPALIEEADALATPWLGLFGDLDESISVADVERLTAALADDAPVATEVVRYADADHGFHCDARPSYHEASATDGWARTLAWFDTHLA